MKKSKPPKAIGILLIISAVTLLIPYGVLTITFNYPAILREDTATILTAFHKGGEWLIYTWFAFALTGLPLIPAYILIGQQYENETPLVRIATNIGVIGLVAQLVGLLRWTFVVPVLANTFVQATDEATKAAAILSFKTIHQFGGVILGEHIGQLFTIVWTLLITISFMKIKLFPKWVHAAGILSAIIYFMAQAELFATVIAGFPVWSMAGFIGSTLWLVWLIVIGINFLKIKNSDTVLTENF